MVRSGEPRPTVHGETSAGRRPLTQQAGKEHQGYRRLGRNRPHQAVNHQAGEYVRGEIHTANIDSFWSLIKRGIMGNFHHVSARYLPLYLNEFSFRHNNRENDDIFSAVVAGS